MSHSPELRFTYLVEVSFAPTSILGLGSCDVCLLMIPIVFDNAAGLGLSLGAPNQVSSLNGSVSVPRATMPQVVVGVMEAAPS